MEAKYQSQNVGSYIYTVTKHPYLTTGDLYSVSSLSHLSYDNTTDLSSLLISLVPYLSNYKN